MATLAIKIDLLSKCCVEDYNLCICTINMLIHTDSTRFIIASHSICILKKIFKSITCLVLKRIRIEKMIAPIAIK